MHTNRSLKRSFDCFVVIFFLPVFLVLFAALSILIKISGKGPVLFIQPRVGVNNNVFYCYKIRTMHSNLCDYHGGISTARDDARVTQIGKWLRRTSLDEIPQIINVLKGEMSLVGPRPHALGSKAEGIALCDAVSGYDSRHAVLPGITGLAQIRGLRGTMKQRADLEARLKADLEYIESWSVWLDIKILFKSIFIVLRADAF